jgi:hypothetical protein
MDYDSFLSTKLARDPATGLPDVRADDLHPSLFPFQRDLVAWALRRGRAAVFASTGLGKSRQAAAWAGAVEAATHKPVLVLTPLAVAAQWVSEAAHVDVPAHVCRVASDARSGSLNVTNYDRLHKFDTSMFGGVVWDESSVAKHFTTSTFADLRDAFKATPFRLACTATPAPNDYTELGSHAELLGVCSRTEMLSEYFVHDGGDTSVWRLKGHARSAFWRWVSSWGALVTHPRDLGYEQQGYDLPPLVVEEHLLHEPEAARVMGVLFVEEAKTLADQRAARRSSIGRRVEAAVKQISREPGEAWIAWCDLNDESSALAASIPDSVEVTGSMDIDEKERRIASFVNREARVLVTKPAICSFGLNLQFCARQAFVGVTHSFEAYFQAVRRSWRFGQTRPVNVHVFASELEGAVVANLRRKERDADAMARALGAETAAGVRAEVRGLERETNPYEPKMPMTIPSWLTTEEKSA